MNIRRFHRGLLVCLILMRAGNGFAQSSLDQLLKDTKKAAADAKKEHPENGQKNKDDGLPPGYDNSWRMNMSYVVTQKLRGHKSQKSTNCRNTNLSCTEINDLAYDCIAQANVSSAKIVGFSSGDEVEISSYAATSDKYLKFAEPMTGSAILNWQYHNSVTGCCTPDYANYNGNGQMDPNLFQINFHYNRHTKEGNLDMNGGNMDAPTSHVTATGSMAANLPDGQTIVRETSWAMGGAFWACAVNNIGLNTTGSLAATCQFLGEKLSVTETKNGYQVSYSATKNDTNSDGQEATWTVSLQLSITRGSPPEYEAVIEPLALPVLAADSYDNWIPKGAPVITGNTQNPLNNKGNTIAFHVRILERKSGKDVTDLHPFSVQYSLNKVSNYKGVCMNFPKKEDADDKPDLRWDSLYYENNTHYTEKKEATLASKDKEGSQLDAVVTSYDYAAFGELKAHVHLNDDDVDMDAHLTGKPGEMVITIPKDENRNKIADKWEKDVGMYDKTADADFDEDAYPKNQKRNGDGYTLFEEYRGFKVEDNLLPDNCHETFTDGYLRMDPNYKDIFINDRNELFKTYYAPYNPSDLCWHYINNDEMVFTSHSKDPENRWTNFNKVPEHFYANQYALILADMPAKSATCDCSKLTVGEQIDYDKVTDYETDEPVEAPGTESAVGFEQAVKHTYIIMFYSGDVSYCIKGVSSSTDQRQDVFQTTVIGTITHEIGHAIGITHHHPETDGGVVKCSMRYDSPVESGHHKIVATRHYYCRKGDTWTELADTPPDENNPGKAVPLKTISHESDDCYGQIDIKSDP